MEKNIGLVWLKDDFRIRKNHALIEATKNHNHVVTFFLFKKKKFENQEAQKWWVSKSLIDFKKKLNEYNIGLEIVKTDTYKNFFEKLFNKKIFQFIGIRHMNQIILILINICQKILKKIM